MECGFVDEIPQDVFTNLQQIGCGTFSDVFSAIHLNTNSKVALKISIKNKNEEDLKAIKQEININKSLNHPFICKYYSTIETEHLMIIVMELIEGTDALNYVNQSRGLSLSESLNIFSQLIIAIEYLHEEAHITHRDLKLENIMIDKYNHIRLIDFGFSSINTMMTTCCGSIPYCAPEVLSGQNYTKAADIWSMGIILYALIDGNLPFFHSNINILAEIICQKEVKFSPIFPSKQVEDLIQKMLIKDPDDRITIEEIKQHPAISRQNLFKINYKQLFKTNPTKSINLSSHLSLQDQYLYKNPISFLSGNGPNHPINQPTFTNKSMGNNHNLILRSKNEDIESLDDSIEKRKDFAVFLNKIIESALLDNPAPRNISLHSAISAKLGQHYRKRNSHHCVFKNSTPLLQPNVNSNHNYLNNIYFDKK